MRHELFSPATTSHPCFTESPCGGGPSHDRGWRPRESLRRPWILPSRTKNGVLLTREVKLPAFQRGAYFAGGLGSNFKWPRLANQMTPWFVYDNDMTTLFAKPFAKNPCKTIGRGAQTQGMFALYQLESGEYLTLLSLSKGSAMSWLQTSKEGEMSLVLGHFGKGEVSGRVPLLVWGKDKNLYRSLIPGVGIGVEGTGGVYGLAHE